MKKSERNVAYLFDNSNIFSTESIYPELHNSEFYIPHYHTYYEMVLILKGRIEHYFCVLQNYASLHTAVQNSPPPPRRYIEVPYNYSSEILSAGDLQIISPEVCHYYRFDDPKSEYINIAISSKLFRGIVKTLNTDKFDALPLKITLPPDQMDLLKSEFFQAEDDSLSVEDRGALHKILTMHAMRYFIAETERSKFSVPQWMRELTALLNNPNYYALTIDEIISNVPYSHSYICREFKNTFGTSLKKYFTQKKMKHACYLLQNTDMKIITIASSLGYDNQGFFAHVFYEQFALTPIDYRKAFSAHRPKEPDA